MVGTPEPAWLRLQWHRGYCQRSAREVVTLSD